MQEQWHDPRLMSCCCCNVANLQLEESIIPLASPMVKAVELPWFREGLRAAPSTLTNIVRVLRTPVLDHQRRKASSASSTLKREAQATDCSVLQDLVTRKPNGVGEREAGRPCMLELWR